MSSYHATVTIDYWSDDDSCGGDQDWNDRWQSEHCEPRYEHCEPRYEHYDHCHSHSYWH